MSITLDGTNGITSPGIIGVTDGSNATAGTVGEYIDSYASGTTVSGSPTTMTSISLTAGDWDVSGAVNYNGNSTPTYVQGGIGTTTNSFSGTSTGKTVLASGTNTTAGTGSVLIPRFRVSITTTTTYYLVGQLSSTSQTCQGYISARRMR